jgi:hypothetical protein
MSTQEMPCQKSANYLANLKDAQMANICHPRVNHLLSRKAGSQGSKRDLLSRLDGDPGTCIGFVAAPTVKLGDVCHKQFCPFPFLEH